jgi:hypothetical protein
MGSYVGIDLHRRRSVIVVMNEDGETLSTTRTRSDPELPSGKFCRIQSC